MFKVNLYLRIAIPEFVVEFVHCFVSESLGKRLTEYKLSHCHEAV